jgi:molybdenum cofactor cytidylyltransferase
VSRCGQMFAVIPDAGENVYPAEPNLLLPLAGIPIIRRFLSALDHPAVSNCYIVVRSEDTALEDEASRRVTVLVAPANASVNTRACVSLALETIKRDFAPGDDDGWLLAPADHPVLDWNLVDAMMNCWQQTAPAILVPRFKERRGHPTLFRWRFAEEVARIPAGRGLNWLLREYASEVAELIVDNDSAIADLDTVEHYARLQAKWPDSIAY